MSFEDSAAEVLQGAQDTKPLFLARGEPCHLPVHAVAWQTDADGHHRSLVGRAEVFADTIGPPGSLSGHKAHATTPF
jgi:hypothetical protein